MEKQRISFIFDLDGTILDTNKDIFESLLLTFQKNKLEIDSKNINEYLTGFPLDTIIDKLFPYLSLSKKKQIIADFKNIYDSCGFPNTKLYGNIDLLFKWIIENNYEAFIATNKRKIPTKLLLEKFNISEYITETVCSDTFGIAKSKDEMVSYLLKKWNINFGVMVGDTSADLIAAGKNQLISIFVLYGYGNEKSLKLYKPDYIIENSSEFIKTAEIIKEKYINN